MNGFARPVSYALPGWPEEKNRIRCRVGASVDKPPSL